MIAVYVLAVILSKKKAETHTAMPNELVRKTISLDADVYARAEENANARGFKASFSAYVAWLIQRDMQGGVTREELGTGNDPAPVRGKPVTYAAPRRRKSSS